MKQNERISCALIKAIQNNHEQWRTARELFEYMIKISGYTKVLSPCRVAHLLKKQRLLTRKRFSGGSLEYYCDLSIQKPKIQLYT